MREDEEVMSLSVPVCSITIATQLVELSCKNKGGCGGLDDMARRRKRKWEIGRETTQ